MDTGDDCPEEPPPPTPPWLDRVELVLLLLLTTTAWLELPFERHKPIDTAFNMREVDSAGRVAALQRA